MRRSWRDSAFAFVVGLAFAALGALFARFEVRWAAGLFFFIAACGALLALVGSYEAPCPSCGRAIHHLLPGANGYIRCGACARYAWAERGALRPIEADHVAREPAFALEVRPGLELPRLCCACGQPSTREEATAVRLRVGVGPAFGVGPGTRHVAMAPHCGAHAGGAVLTRENLSPAAAFSVETLVTGPETNIATVFKVRSYRFYLAALSSRKEPAAS